MTAKILSLSLLTCLPLSAEIVINELHIDEADKTLSGEFIELYNTSSSSVNLSDWEFSDGVTFTFPSNTVIPGNGYLVIAQDPATIASEFGHSGALGPWQGQLRNSGERVTLQDQAGNTIDEVSYQLGFPWPTIGDEPSPSMELINPFLDNDLGGNWRSSGNILSSTVPDTTYISTADTQWRYREGLTYPATDSTGKTWIDNGYDESSSAPWISATAPIGYGDSDDNTVLSDMRFNYISFFMRHEFTIPAGQIPDTLTLRALYDDGMVIYINGTEVTRFSLNSGPIAFPPPAAFAIEHEANDYEEITLFNTASYLLEGTNTIALQLINRSLESSDTTADLELSHQSSGQTAKAGKPTPGTSNSVSASNAPPSLRQVNHSPDLPFSSDPVTITTKVTDPDGVASVTLDYQLVAPGDYIKIDDPRYQSTWTSLPMSDDGSNGDLFAGDATFTVIIPASLHQHRQLVRYRIRATDQNSASVTAPYADDPTPNFAYFVYDQVPTWTGSATPSDSDASFDFQNLPTLQNNVAVYQLITTREEHVEAQFIPGSTRSSGYTGSEYLWKGTLVYDGQVYDHIRFRARGGVHRYHMGKNMWKFDFNRGQRFQARDNFGEEYDTEWRRLNFSALIQQRSFGQRGEQGLYESVGFRLFDLAGTVGSSHTHYVHFRIIEDANELGPSSSQFDDDFQGLYLAVEQLDGQYLEEHDLPDGNLYKMEAGTGTLNNQSPDLPSDRSDLDDFLNTYEGSPQTEQWWRDNLDLENYYAYRTIVEAIRHYDIHAGKNYFYFNNPETQKWQVLPWDLDVAWSNNGFGTGNEPFKSRVLAIPALNQEYRNTARHILDLLFNEEQAGQIIDETAQFVWEDSKPSYVDADRAMWDFNPILTSNFVNNLAGHGHYYDASALNPDSFAGMVQTTQNYVQERNTWIKNNILTDSAQIPIQPSITYSGTAGFPANGISVDSSTFVSPVGSSFAAMEYRLAEITLTNDPAFDPGEPRQYEIEDDWTSPTLTTFTPSQTLPTTDIRPGRHYRARVRHLDTAGRWSHWSEPLQFTATAPDTSDYQNRLVISEFMYNPPAPTGDELLVSAENDDFEWLELSNISDADLDLTDVRFTRGIDYDFAPGTIISAGSSLLLVKNEAAFAARYGSDLPVLDNYGSDNLSNSGSPSEPAPSFMNSPTMTKPPGLSAPMAKAHPSSS